MTFVYRPNKIQRILIEMSKMFQMTIKTLHKNSPMWRLFSSKDKAKRRSHGRRKSSKSVQKRQTAIGRLKRPLSSCLMGGHYPKRLIRHTPPLTNTSAWSTRISRNTKWWYAATCRIFTTRLRSVKVRLLPRTSSTSKNGQINSMLCQLQRKSP